MWRFVFVVACLLACLRGGAEAAPCADVALVLAIDGSGSIDTDDFELQRRGYYLALTDPPVQAAFETAGVVDIAAVFWADAASVPQVIPFHRVTGPEDARQFAERLVSMERTVTGSTDIWTGLQVAIDMLDGPDTCAERLVIDVSGNGRSSVNARRGVKSSLMAERKRAMDLGIVINALAITDEDEGLADYYEQRLATGTSSFVMRVSGFDTFRHAIARKIIREVLS